MLASQKFLSKVKLFTSITVARLRAAMDEPNPKGLVEYVQNLLIWVFAEHGHYAFNLHGGEYSPSLKDFPDGLVLIKQDLAEAAVWKKSLITECPRCTNFQYCGIKTGGIVSL